MTNNQYIDTPNSRSKTNFKLDNSVFDGGYPAQYKRGKVYKTINPDTIPLMINLDQGTEKFPCLQNTPNINSLWGFSNLFSPNYAKGVK